MAEFVTVANVGDIPENEGRPFNVNGKVVGVFHSQGGYQAINDFCPHQGASLSAGHVEDGAVTCPWHAWRFKLEDGSWMDAPGAKLKCDSFEVRVQGDEIQVCVPDE